MVLNCEILLPLRSPRGELRQMAVGWPVLCGEHTARPDLGPGCPSRPKVGFRSQDRVAGVEYDSHRPWGLFSNLGEVSLF